MDELFRFVLLRPTDHPADAPAPGGDLHTRLRAARAHDDPGTTIRELAAAFRAGDAFARPADLPILARLADALAALPPEADGAAVTAAVRSALGVDDLTERPEYRAERARLDDSLLAVKLTGGDEPELTGLLRLARAANLAENPGGGVAATLSGPVAVGAGVLPVPVTAAVSPPPAEPPATARAEAARRAAVEQVGQLRAAIDLLATIQPAAAIAAVPAAAANDGPAEGEAAVHLERKRPAALVSVGFAPAVLGEAGAERLPAGVRSLLTAQGVDPVTAPLPVLTRLLEAQLSASVGGIDARGALAAVLGTKFLPVTEAGPHDEALDPAPAVLAGPPATHGQVAPAGVAELLVVRQHTVGYEPGDVAFVENVAPGERLTRTTNRVERSEQTTEIETETVRSDQRDQQSTEHFDLASEASEVVRGQNPPGAATPAYGVVVDSGTHRSVEGYGRGVTSTAAARLTQRVTTRTRATSLREFCEEASHVFDNGAGAAAQTHVYQWLDRVVRAQVFAYGRRLFYDLTVPEPAALLLRALAQRTPRSGPLVRPAPFTLLPDELNAWNYGYYVAGYGATGVEPPPEPIRHVGYTFAGNAQDINAEAYTPREVTKAEKGYLQIPDGYRATMAHLSVTGDYRDINSTIFVLTVGSHRKSMMDLLNKPIALDGLTGQLPISMVTAYDFYLYSATVMVTCEPTAARYAQWQLATHAAISAAAKQRGAEFEERNAAFQAALRMAATGGVTSGRKRAVEREELQRACLAVLTNQHFDTLGAIEHSPQGYPQPFLPNVEPVGRYVRFLQQSFEWDQMSWRYYPYFWGRKPMWLDKLLLDDEDGQFRDFLRAGSARVLIPVRPGFEPAVTHFMDTGDVPATADLGLVTSPQYLPLLAGTTGDTLSIEASVPVGDAWTVRLPTTLVQLRADGTLPAWGPQ
jgi:hypothetical protein